MAIAYVFFLPVEEKKRRKRNQSRVKEKLTTFFTKTVLQKECHAKELHILTTLSFRCSPWAVVRFFLLSTFENSFLTMKNSYHKALVPLRRVNYYKHVKFDLRDNITSRDVTKRVRICLQNSKDQMFG